MKRFQFQLEPVLNYKQQTLDALMIELGKAQADAARQEQVLNAARRHFAEYGAEYEEKKQESLTVVEALKYQSCLDVLEREVKRETAELLRLQNIAEAKRLEVVAARQENFSLEKLKEMRRKEYDAAAAKEEEKTLDDLTIARRFAVASA